MLRLLPRLASLLLIASLPLGASGCAQSQGPVGKFTDLMKTYDKTLTKDQQAAAITEMQSDVKHKDRTAPQDVTSSVAKPAPAQN